MNLTILHKSEKKENSFNQTMTDRIVTSRMSTKHGQNVELVNVARNH